jgi:hypothetical protein
MHALVTPQMFFKLCISTILLLLTTQVSASKTTFPSCCVCQWAADEAQGALDDMSPSEVSIHFMTHFACNVLETTSKECWVLADAGTILAQKLLYDSPPKEWCYNLDICVRDKPCFETDY